ncbi:MAG: hypothetical protein JSV22_10770 [Bacteroidales bacterium]|nr:MAG: hypothetical protein JSV22_10770 [Bacteroidales bacterium]
MQILLKTLPFLIIVILLNPLAAQVPILDKVEKPTTIDGKQENKKISKNNKKKEKKRRKKESDEEIQSRKELSNLATVSSKSIVEMAGEDPFKIKFVGNGNIQPTIEKNLDVSANAGLGVVMDKYYVEYCENDTIVADWMGFYRINFESVINVATTAEDLVAITDDQSNIINQSVFGRSILNPISSGQSVIIKLKGYRTKVCAGLISGYHINLIGSNRDWIINTDTINASSGSLRFGIFHELVPSYYRRNFSVQLSLSYALNVLSNDIALESYDDLREKVLNKKNTNFHGIEFGLAFELKNIRAEFSLPIMLTSSVPGISGARIINNIGFVGGFAIKLND